MMMIFFALVACSAVISVIWLGWIVWVHWLRRRRIVRFRAELGIRPGQTP